ncbi:MAG TPA: sigma-70 family RNA polymerase sigma factor [Gaiella sp.]|jgi:RNA polymerase sigma factor (sigma-70 family)|nr:sigma-70 family RNA polymerase sigma factor [Gaiella sp.]
MIEDTLVEQALHLPRREARRWAHTPLEQEDLVADGNLALAKAAKRYDPSYGVPFSAFATPYVRGAIADTVRSRARRNTLGNGRWADVVGFGALTPSVRSDQAFDPPDPGPTPHDTVENLDRLRVLGTIPERERIALIRTMVDGDTAADVAKDLGVSTDRVYTLVHNGSTRVRRRAA